MKTLYFECKMGAAGDMLMAALYEICDQKDIFLQTMNEAFSGYGIQIFPEEAKKCGISGTHMRVTINGEEELVSSDAAAHHHTHTEQNHEHAHHSYPSILAQIEHLELPAQVKADAAAIYQLIGNAEASVHNTTLEQIHFHEVGTLDALADVCGCALLMYLIAPEKILSSPLHVGSGFVRCAHGVLPVPAPATTELLKGLPFYSGSIKGELLTPTGAAILRHYVEAFQEMPVMTLEQTGYGMGQKDFETANCVRAFLGDVATGDYDDKILSISCNLDDMTGEAISFASESLLNAGALDVYTIPIQMKKGRPGIILTCLCPLPEKETFTRLFFQHTTTRGVRYAVYERAKLTSTFEVHDTSFGKIRIKKSSGYHATHEKPEFEDLKAIALSHECSLDDVLKLLNK
jgi:uncharacterized protein (TIGR00299 family) protein